MVMWRFLRQAFALDTAACHTLMGSQRHSFAARAHSSQAAHPALDAAEQQLIDQIASQQERVKRIEKLMSNRPAERPWCELHKLRPVSGDISNN